MYLIKKKLEKGLKRFVCVTAESDDFVEKNRRFDEKSATKSTFVRTRREAHRSRLFGSLSLLSNLTWRRAHVTAGLTGTDPNVKICIYGDCNAMLLFCYISEKSRLLFYF